MAAHPYSLRNRLNGATPVSSPGQKPGGRSPRKVHSSNVSLQLQRVIGTTTVSPTGLTCCAAADTYAHCAGAVAALTTLKDDGSYSQRYFRARPTASSLNPSASYYETNSPSTTPSRRRSSLFTGRRHDDQQGPGHTRDWLDEGGGQTWTARERIKAVSCVSLSSDGRWLAVGELGYNPRVLLFSTSQDAPTDIPTSIVMDHTFGVRSVGFSPDSRYLATLGNLNDGFLFIWSLNSKTGSLRLHSANKCTTNICDLTWCGNSLMTVGTRHVKVWQIGENTRPSPMKRFKLRAGSEEVTSPGPAALQGRNCLLGSLVDCTFTCIALLTSYLAVVGTETGHLCAVDLSQGTLELKIVKLYDFGISSITHHVATGKLIIGGHRGLFHEDVSNIKCLIQANPDINSGIRPTSRKGLRLSSIRQSLGFQQSDLPGIVAVGSLSKHIVALDSNGSLLVELASNDLTDLQTTFASHNDVIQGAQAIPPGSSLGSFCTWSSNGDVKFWNEDGALVDRKRVSLEDTQIEDEDCQNELRVIRYISTTKVFVTGDRFGVLKVINSADWNVDYVGRGHSAEVTDITAHEELGLLATCSRDRMVQLFSTRGAGLELIQTMDEHIGAVTRLIFSSDAQRLLSCSSDRTIVVRERVKRHSDGGSDIAYLSSRVVTLKSTPLSMTFAEDNSSVVLVSTSDRYVVKVDASSGAFVDTFKVSDPENDDTVALNSICSSRKGNSADDTTNLLVSYSSTDKSIRLYDTEKCSLLTRESGHTEGISGMCLLEQRQSDGYPTKTTVISTGLDGTIMMWNIAHLPLSLVSSHPEVAQSHSLSPPEGDGTPAKASPVSLPPLRKVLTKMDVVDFTQSSAPPSPASPRSLSPARLTRKKSQLALSTTIDEQDEDEHLKKSEMPAKETAFDRGRTQTGISPSSASSRSSTTPKKQRSRSEAGPELGRRRAQMQRSPSPPPLPSTPVTPSRRQPSSNTRLRRPPSVPTDLRGQAMAQGRRQSVSQASDFGSIAMATEQACRMLRTYRKKLAASKEELVLDELEDELETIMKAVRERKDRTSAARATRRPKAKATTENDVDELAVLLDKTNMADTSPRTNQLGK